MSIVKSFSVGEGDTFYIKHVSDSFSIIDCNLVDDRRDEIIEELEDIPCKNRGTSCPDQLAQVIKT